METTLQEAIISEDTRQIQWCIDNGAETSCSLFIDLSLPPKDYIVKMIVENPRFRYRSNEEMLIIASKINSEWLAHRSIDNMCKLMGYDRCASRVEYIQRERLSLGESCKMDKFLKSALESNAPRRSKRIKNMIIKPYRPASRPV